MDVTEQLNAGKAKYKTTEVEKLVPLDFDLRNLAAFDSNPIDPAALKKSPDAYLRELAREGVQLLMNEIFQLPTETEADGVFAKLPDATTPMARAKPIPKEKAQTRWEKFAATKGITKTKKSRMEFDDASQSYKPRWGYKGPDNATNDDWLIEVPQKADPMEDQYEKRKEEKKERVDKNKMQHRRNREETVIKESGRNPHEVRKNALQQRIVESKTSTASLGKFDKALYKEDQIKRTVKRKFDSTTKDGKEEKEASLNLAKKVLKGGDAGVVNVTKVCFSKFGSGCCSVYLYYFIGCETGPPTRRIEECEDG
ncbi:ribosome biogenesis regulatory protein [Phlyctochytrium arcticum]|nr:ribosome biogenesis regulatory protein [Phlyctochytrium arcticum]